MTSCSLRSARIIFGLTHVGIVVVWPIMLLVEITYRQTGGHMGTALAMLD